MKSILFIFLSFSLSAHAESPVRLSIIKTGQARSFEWMTLADGNWSKVISNHSAFLIEHPQGNILVDTGLGDKIDEQFAKDMTHFHRSIFAYEKGLSAKTQLENEKVNFSFILLTHMHFDHISALVDFPGIEVWALPEEMAFREIGHPPAILPSQVKDPATKWKPYNLDKKEFMGFNESFDIYNDQSIVVVPLRGHTPGSVGIIITLKSGKKVFLIGDTVWRKKGVDTKKGKFWFARNLVDFDDTKVLEQISKLNEFQREYPEVILMPSHDESVQRPFGYFPARIE